MAMCATFSLQPAHLQQRLIDHRPKVAQRMVGRHEIVESTHRQRAFDECVGAALRTVNHLFRMKGHADRRCAVQPGFSAGC
jgi:hypothetical protein